MYKVRVSKKNPFWARNNENKPSNDIFKKWLNENMKEVQYLPIIFIDFTKILFNGNYEDIRYIEITNINDPNDVRYYYVDKIQLEGGNNTFRYSGILDVYTSYTLSFIEDNFDKEFVFLRKHEYDKKCLQIRDKFLDELPKIYSNYEFKKINFPKNNNIWYSDEIAIVDNNNLLNANRYYVFKDGVNGGYTFYPIISESKDIDIYTKDRIKGTLKYEKNYWNGNCNGDMPKQEISSELNNKVVEAYKNNEYIEFLFHEPNGNAHILSHWTAVEDVPYGTLPIDVKTESKQWAYAGNGIKRAQFVVYLLGNVKFDKTSGNTLAWDHTEQWEACQNFRELKVKIYNTHVEWTKKTIKNSITSLEELRKKEENINKFLGIFFMPHFLNFSSAKLNFKDNYVFININPQDDHIKLFPIYEYQQSNIINKINNSTFSTEYFLRFLNIKYYGNDIHAEFRTNDQHKIYLGGRLLFTDTCSIISKSNEYMSLQNSIIQFPYQLPIGVDTYEQYVKANRNVTETGYNIARQQQQLATARSITNGVINMSTAGVKAAGDFLSGDFGAAVGDIVGGVTSGINTGFDVFGQMQGLKQQEAKIRAQYQQANNTMGNSMNFSNVETASLLEYYNDSSHEQYEGVEVSTLDPNVLVIMNNYIFLNGYLSPNSSTFKLKIKNERKFNYIQLDSTLLENELNINYNSAKMNNGIYDLVKAQLTSGVRIWNEIGNEIPTYDPNEDWPDQPIDRPIVPPPSPPPLNEIIFNWEIKSNWKFNNRINDATWSGYSDILTITSKMAIVEGYDNINNDYDCEKTNIKTYMYREGLDKNNNYVFNIDCKNLKLSDFCKNKNYSDGIALGEAYVNKKNNKNVTINFINVSNEIINYINDNVDGKNVYYDYCGNYTEYEESCNINKVTVNGKVVYE